MAKTLKIRRNKILITVTISPQQNAWLQGKSVELGISKAEFVRRIIDETRIKSNE